MIFTCMILMRQRQVTDGAGAGAGWPFSTAADDRTGLEREPRRWDAVDVRGAGMSAPHSARLIATLRSVREDTDGFRC